MRTDLQSMKSYKLSTHNLDLNQGVNVNSYFKMKKKTHIFSMWPQVIKKLIYSV